uniref:Uncharacterized protein n=1 Tax=Odontella aurita TaxID=265563 RepID=A0A7S4HL89_9STRA
MAANRLLSDRKYDIEFNGYLSNHAKHAIIALDRIRASEERIQEWWDEYTKSTPYGLRLHPVDQVWDDVVPCSAAEWTEIRGKKEKWQEMCIFLQNELRDRFGGDEDELVRAYAPALLPGMAGALTHGIIHLGWAVDAKSEWMTVEGLSYLNYCFLGLDTNKIRVNDEFCSEKTPLESLIRIARMWEEQGLANTWIASVKSKYGEDFHSELVPAGFQWELAKVLREPHEVATTVPNWIVDTPLSVLWEWLYRTVVLLYLASIDAEGNGNFLVLHAITSLWGLDHVLRVIDDDALTRKSLQQFYCMLVCLLSASTAGFPSADTLSVKADEYAFSSREHPEWKVIEERGISEEEEHNIKLVYVCHELWKRYGEWSGFCEAARSFTLTPNIGPRAAVFKA